VTWSIVQRFSTLPRDGTLKHVSTSSHGTPDHVAL